MRKIKVCFKNKDKEKKKKNGPFKMEEARQEADACSGRVRYGRKLGARHARDAHLPQLGNLVGTAWPIKAPHFPLVFNLYP